MCVASIVRSIVIVMLSIWANLLRVLVDPGQSSRTAGLCVCQD
jgi:hypothetical protein